MRDRKDDLQADRNATKPRTKRKGFISLEKLRADFKLKDKPFPLNPLTVDRILREPPVASLIPFGDNLYLQHDRPKRSGRDKARGRWYRRHHVEVIDKNGKPRLQERREFLGNTDKLTPTQARDANDRLRLKLVDGVDLQAERKAAKVQRQAQEQTRGKEGITLADVWGKVERPESMSRRRWAIQLLKSRQKGGNRHGTPIETYLDSVVAAQFGWGTLQKYIYTWENDIKPTIGHIPIVKLTPENIARAVAPRWDQVEGDRLLWQIHDMIEFARAAMGVLIPVNPAYMEKPSKSRRRRRAAADALSRLLGPKDPHKFEHLPPLPIEDLPRFHARLRATPESNYWLRMHPGQRDRRMLAALVLFEQVGGREKLVCSARYSQIHNYPHTDLRKKPLKPQQADGQFVRGLEIRHREGKGGTAVIPLTDFAWAIIERCAAEDGIDLNAPPSQRDVPIFHKTGALAEDGSGSHWSKYLRMVGDGADPPFSHHTIHADVRSCFSTWAYAKLETERRSDPNKVIEMCQLHTTKTKTQEAYDRNKFYEERRVWLEDWSKFLASGKLAPGEIVNMNKHKPSYIDDTELLDTLHETLTNGKATNIYAAVMLAMPRKSKKERDKIYCRVKHKYRRIYGYDGGRDKRLSDEDYRPLVDEMHVLLTNQEVRGLWHAATKAAAPFKGTGKFDTIRQTLCEKYEKTYGNSEKYKYNGYTEQDAPLLKEIEELVASGMYLQPAIKLVSPKAAGRGDPYGRLYSAYVKIHPDYERCHGYAETYVPFVEDMHRLLTTKEAASRPEAAWMVARTIEDDETRLDLQKRRLINYYRDTYGDDFRTMATGAEELLEEMHRLITTRKASLHGAAGIVAHRAPGSAKVESKQRRLETYYVNRYGKVQGGDHP